ncbi:hypothetical protein GHK86_02910 [Acidimicrobiaceae bacterium USS-CC1]|uniref:Uncharacterized protein n=1 Tax=Acidiferrimicrobium australe TaxID=2664430 RepID=A0ABW9QQB1_9ACTN|nr:hypothetical protein [Acidiferrimicrobium australe]
MTSGDDPGGASHPLDQLAQIIGACFDPTTFDTGTFETGAFDGHGFDTGELDDVAAPTHWPSLPSADSAAEWTELRAWVEALQGRFAHLDHHVIPRCWWRHNDHVEALAALRDHERSSFAPTAPATAPLDWFRAQRDIAALLKAWTADLGCAAAHTDPPTPLRAVDNREWERFVTDDVARRREAEIEQAAQ